MRVVFTEAAESELEAVSDWIATDNPERAITFVAEIAERCHSLADSPEAFPIVPRYKRAGVRRLVFRDYLIFYRISRDRVEILHILHGARDYEAILDSS
ncbi:MAG TPA: type II toxin-antitoxin system RelE/ParE family toxin [Aestuariivirgaceae bacterium]|nr:type II toxin-antitoxin system RelE/ParE family toxin [Aestuariivirgaceae bacterium]